jgi:molecular chaperone DnaJ
MPVTDNDDHYSVLGVRADATADEIRDAYRSMARRLHPDHAEGEALGDRMARLNEAYYVLRDPGRRAIYDAARRPVSPFASHPTATPAAPPASDRDPRYPFVSPPERARFPWRWVVIFAAVGSLLVGGLSVFVGPEKQPKPDNLLQVGSCVAIEVNGDARETPCTPGDDLVVQELIPFDETCPYGTRGHRDRQGLGIACIAPSAADEDE